MKKENRHRCYIHRLSRPMCRRVERPHAERNGPYDCPQPTLPE